MDRRRPEPDQGLPRGASERPHLIIFPQARRYSLGCNLTDIGQAQLHLQRTL